MSQISYGTITITDIPSAGGDLNQHFWFNPTTTGTVEAGAYITNTAIDSFKNNKSGGYALVNSNGLKLGNGNTVFVELNGNALNFYKPNGATAATLSATGLDIVNGSISLGTYDSTYNTYPFQVDSTGQFFSGKKDEGYIRVYRDTNDNNIWKINISANEINLGGTNLGPQLVLKSNLASEINAVADQITLSADRIVLQGQDATVQIGLTTLQNAVQVDPNHSSIIMGDESSFHIKIIGDSTDDDYGLGFYYGNTKVSYMSDQRLNIPYSVVLKEMQLSNKWSWTQKESGNMTLVWIGETTTSEDALESEELTS